jgi:hypothetical protein
MLYKNYIPHKKNSSFLRWYKEYELHLLNLYGILNETLDERYEKEDNDKDISFNNFCKFIYDTSSKYVMRY